MKTQKSHIIFFLLFSLMILFVLFGIYIQEKDSVDAVRFIVNTKSTSEKISLFHNEDKYYAFLPSYADFCDMELECPTGCFVYIDDKDYSSGKTLESLEINKDYKIKIKNSLGITVAEETIVIMKSKNVPSLSIQLTNGSVNDIDKTTGKTGTCTLIKEDKSVDYNGSFDSIHGRGNSSWDQHKKPYALEFTENVNLLNIGSNKNWVLVANAMDESNIRDKIVYEAAKDVGLSYSVGSEYVDLFIDDNYYGLYLLTEKIEVGENRININDLYAETQKVNQKSLKTYDKFEQEKDGIYMKAYDIPNNPSDITGGYLVELELSGRVINEDNLFRTKSQQNVTVKYPKYISKSEMEYISSLFQTVESKLETNEIFDLIDLNSWADYYLTQEIFSNTSSTSFFFYKDSGNGKIYAGPIWDFDLSLGTKYDGENSKPNQFFVNNWGWFEKLYKNPKFYEAVKQKYNSYYRDLILDIIHSKINDYSEYISDSYLMNEKRWMNIQSNWWVNHYDSQEEHIDYLKDYLSKRIEFLDGEWGNSTSIGTSSYHNDNENSIENVKVEPQKPAEQASMVATIKSFISINRYLIFSVSLFLLMLLVVVINIFVDYKNRRYKNGRKY